MANGQHWVVNSEHSKTAFIAQVDKWFAEHKHLTFPAPRIGKDRSLPQNALFHVFCTEWVAYKLNKPTNLVAKAELEGMKRTTKKLAYIHLRQDFLIHTITDYDTGATKKEYTSSKGWKRGEMFMVLELMQNLAAEDGLILESKGEFKKLQESENA